MISNYPHNFVDHAKTIAAVVAHAERSGFSEVEADKAAVDAWVKLVLTGRPGLIGSSDCTPGYYNNEGQGLSERQRQSMGHPGGPAAFFKHIEEWRNSGNFEGLSFS
jgi:cyclohexanone monooxygenase